MVFDYFSFPVNLICWRTLAYTDGSWIWKPSSISTLGRWPHYTGKQSINHADLLGLPRCALGKTINVKTLHSSPSPHKWDSLLGYRDNGSPSPERKWKALYPWDMINSLQAWSREERCLCSACLDGRTPLHSIRAGYSLSVPLRVSCMHYT